FVRLFQAAPTIQRPVLIDAVRRAKDGTRDSPAWRRLRSDIITELNRMIAHSRGTDRGDAKTIRKLADGLSDYLGENALVIEELCKLYKRMDSEGLTAVGRLISTIAREGIANEGGQYESYAPIDAGKRNRIR